MNILFFICSSVCYILLAAHFLRSGDLSLSAVMAACIALNAVKRRWSRYICTIILSAGIPVWIMTAAEAIQLRIISDSPWVRLSLIMGAVTAFFALTAVLCLKSVRNIQARNTDKAAGAAAVLTVIILFIGRAKAPFPVIMMDRFIPGSGTFEILLLGIYAGFITELFLSLKDTSRLRRIIWAGFSILFFTQLLLGISGVNEFLMTGKLHVPVPAVIIGGPIFRGHGFFMMILFLITIIAAGPAWCSYFCYFGAWDNVAASKVKKSGSVFSKNILSRILTLTAVIVTALLFRIFSISNASAAASAIAFGITGLIIMAGVSRKRGVMIHCTSYCPVGLAASVMGKLSPFRLRIQKTCTSCMACSKVCRYGALERDDVKSLRPGLTCTLCGDCINVCHSGSIHYSFPGLSHNNSRILFTVIVISIHAAFLGFARI